MSRGTSTLLTLALGLSSCGGAASTAPLAPADDRRGADAGAEPAADAGVDAAPASDAATLPLSCGVELGVGVSVCKGLVDPTTTGGGIVAVDATLYRAPGQAFFCRPQETAASNGKLLIHLVGTGDDPARDNAFPRLACALGFAAIAPMYENEHDARSTCKEDESCYEGFHAAIVRGVSPQPPPVAVDVANSIDGRVASLLGWLAARDAGFGAWSTFQASFASGALGSIVISGHSQGGGHAAYASRDRAFERVVLLASPGDRLRSGTPTHAAVPWVASYAAVAKTAPERRYGYIHADDEIEVVAQVDDTWNLLGLGATSCAFSSLAGYPAACRRIRTASAGCTPFNSHSSVTVAQFGLHCELGQATNKNPATWRFLLTNP